MGHKFNAFSLEWACCKTSTGQEQRLPGMMFTFPKKKGGLGLCKLEEWNKATVMRFIWSLFARAISCGWHRFIYICWEENLFGRKMLHPTVIGVNVILAVEGEN